MIGSVSNVNFKGIDNSQDFINKPGAFSATPDIPNDSVELSTKEDKKSNTGVKVLIGTLIAGLAAFAGLGYAVKSGKLVKAEIPTEGMFAKAWAHVKNAGVTVGKWAEKCWDTVAGWFGKKGAETATDAASKAE